LYRESSPLRDPKPNLGRELENIASRLAAAKVRKFEYGACMIGLTDSDVIE
jgi:hypothetical protein